MRDYIKRLLIAILMAVCVSLLILGGKHSEASGISIKEATAKWVWPSNGVITDTFGTRNGTHKGIDIAGDYGTPIYSVDNGKIVKSYYSSTYGHVIFIKHNNQTETVYAHLKKRYVKEGQNISRGEQIGEMGNTGDSSGVHLHFEVHKNEWTFKKENAFDPALALGEGEKGQVVVALSSREKENDVVEVTASPQLINEKIIQKRVSQIESTTQIEIEDNSIIHIVRSGETLWSISKRYGTTVQNIRQLNKINGNHIQVNQQLTIEKGIKKEYVVRKGDTLTSIALKENLSVKEMKEINKLTNDIIKPNQVLLLE